MYDLIWSSTILRSDSDCESGENYGLLAYWLPPLTYGDSEVDWMNPVDVNDLIYRPRKSQPGKLLPTLTLTLNSASKTSLPLLEEPLLEELPQPLPELEDMAQERHAEIEGMESLVQMLIYRTEPRYVSIFWRTYEGPTAGRGDGKRVNWNTWVYD